jgi:transketolase
MSMIDAKLARRLSRIGIRATYGQTLFEMAKADDRLVAVSADLGRSSGLNQMQLNYPERCINTGIAEQNMIGVSAGLASQNFTVFASSFAPFISMRASEQVRMNLGYMQFPVNLVALGSGVSMGFLGNSHYGLEDIAIMRAIPGITIISPADCVELKKVLKAVQSYKLPTYVRLTGSTNTPIVYESDYNFEIGKSHIFGDGEISIVATGSMVHVALQVRERLKISRGVNVAVVNMHTIKPLDIGCLRKIASSSDLVVSLEEHSIIGGLGSALAEVFTENSFNTDLLRIGVQDQFTTAGDYQFTLAQCGLSVHAVYDRILKHLGI